MNKAFSLVELSIVLVILGLLVGGVLTGQSLIRAAELRSVSTDISRYQTASITFRDRFFALPGDMRNATAFWGDNASACTDATVTDGTPGTCNGNGDGILASLSTANTSSEEFQFWLQLSLAGLIEGTYTGLTDASGGPETGVNLPRSKLSQTHWRARNFNPIPGIGTTTNAFAIDLGNSLHQGSAVLVPEELWNIDTKIDDGLPAQGRVIARPWDSNCTLAASRTDFTAAYSLTETAERCVLYIKDAF